MVPRPGILTHWRVRSLEILALMTQEHIEDEIKDTGNFRESIHQIIVEIDELSTQINWKRPEIQISQFLSLILIRLLKVLASERENCRRLTLRNSKLIPFSFNPFWDSFASAVDDNPGLSDVDKLNYLRNLLVGPVEGYRLQQKFTSQLEPF